MTDEQIKKIFESATTIAVVGLSNDPFKASHGVARYLMSQGYTLIPVNPNSPQVLGLPSFPDLASLGRPVDVVQIFRPSADVPPIVDQAIAIGARAVWMQEGIAHPGAAHKAEAAGLGVVMNRCMMKEHYRLIGARLDIE
ncbi:MAG TPA: CoA-binding protein [Anaerolineales bacterium]|nr:CoA-binding protein [Anaerolineales bacterium]